MSYLCPDCCSPVLSNKEVGVCKECTVKRTRNQKLDRIISLLEVLVDRGDPYTGPGTY